MVHAVNINKTTTSPLLAEEAWRQATLEDHDLRYIKRILSIPEETHVDAKEFRNKGYVKSFQERRLEMDNGLISYSDTVLSARVR